MEELGLLEAGDDGHPGDADQEQEQDEETTDEKKFPIGGGAVEPGVKSEFDAVGENLVQMSMVKIVEAELKTLVRDDMRAAIMTASIRPRSPGEDAGARMARGWGKVHGGWWGQFDQGVGVGGDLWASGPEPGG